jgi:pyruvate kinase
MCSLLPQVVVPKLISNGLRWQCSGDFSARQCLQYRGVIPVCADPSLGSPDGAILRAALEVVSGVALGGGGGDTPGGGVG